MLSFHVFVGHLHILFGKMSIQVLCPFLNQVVGLFDVELCKFVVYSRYYPWSHDSCKCLLLFNRLHFLFIDSSFHYLKGFSLMLSHLFSFAFILLAWCVIKDCDASSIVLDLKVALAIRGLLCFHTNFRIIHPSSVKNATGITLTLLVPLGGIVVLAILIPPVREHSVFFHLYSHHFHKCLIVFSVQVFYLLG